jgi:predicted dehydrogenase
MTMLERVLVIGCGSIGQRHIRNLRALGVREIGAFDPLAERLEHAARDYGATQHASIGEGLARQPEAVLVCTPPHLHTAVAQQAVDAGAHVLVEKPLAHTLDGLDDLLDAARERNRIVYIGYNLRFHAGLLNLRDLLSAGAIGKLYLIKAEFGQYLPDWRPGRDYRSGYNASMAMGGGIILDASHELDYVRWLGGEVESVFCAAGRLSGLEMDVEDTAAITLYLRNNVLAEIHLDCIQRGYTRNCKLIGEAGTLFWDFKTGVRLLTAGKEWHEFPLAPDPNQMYVDELRHFGACVRGEEKPQVDGATGKRILEIALAARRSAAAGTRVAI